MHLVIAAHLATTAPPVTALRADVPPPVAELIAHCLEKEWAPLQTTFDYLGLEVLVNLWKDTGAMEVQPMPHLTAGAVRLEKAPSQPPEQDIRVTQLHPPFDPKRVAAQMQSNRAEPGRRRAGRVRKKAARR